MINKLVFATTNENKLKEAQQILNIPIEGISLEIDEVQSLDPQKVITQKALDYYQQIQKPLFVEDTSFIFKSLNLLPGTYINDFSESIGNEGLIKLLDNQINRDAIATVTIGYIFNLPEVIVFTGSISGTISLKVQGNQGFGWDPIFIPDGEARTFAQMSMEEKNIYSMRTIALNKFKDWLVKNT